MAESRYKRNWRRISRVKKALDHSLKCYFDIFTFLITPEMGKRFYWVRQKMGLSQRDFGKLFGLTQMSICRLETGKLTYIPMTVTQFKTVLSDHFSYVSHGSGSWNYEPVKRNKSDEIRDKYYNKPHWSKNAKKV